MASFVPVCRTIPWYDPIIKKLIVETKATYGNCATKSKDSKFIEKLNLIKYARKNACKLIETSINKTIQRDVYVDLFFKKGITIY